MASGRCRTSTPRAWPTRQFIDAGVPTTFLLTSFYWDNLIYFGMGPRKGEDGTLGFVLPMGKRKLPGIAASDIGAAAYGIFKAGKEYIGKTVGISGEHLTGAEMAAQTSATCWARRCITWTCRGTCIARSDFPGADDLGNMFQFNHDFAERVPGSAQRGVFASAQPVDADFFTVAGTERA